ncbi:RNA polymerase sigma factor [Clostridium faecium]|uniref:Sigma-70 family RNA polymerase sigma factor n=1 Tax=Clostridium faecium TaxID=2762223 RepID=A0ABR8YNF1_9CLOT|nr:sigma-70 family RNA polymerase sigma factor [Clostridium faecium]MBD8045578.1 sigma-70 family RNA polymerase sigma factor [Clostridium faecium]MDU1349927.1 sigma-70 family RNA polymerase sigma factor [Clostridium argentinense]
MAKVDVFEDINLVNNVLKGDVDSFNTIVNKYELMVVKFVYNILKQKEASEDITQEVFITVYNKLYMYNKKFKFSNWILQIAKNKTIDYIRKHNKICESNIDEAYHLSSKDMSPEQIAEYKETKEDIKKYIDKLNENDKQILILRYSQNLTFSDIAEILKMTESTVKGRYYRIRENYKAYVKEKEVKYK